MLDKEIELVDQVMNEPGVWSHKREAWNRIKKDYKELAQQITNNARAEIWLIAESIVSCINEGQYDNAKVLAESIIAELSPIA